MQIEATQPRRIERALWQDLSEGHDNRSVKIKRLELLEHRIILKADRGGNRDSEHFGQLVYRRFLLRLTPSALAWRLGVDPHDLMPRCGDLGERTDGKIRRTHKGEAKRHAWLIPVKIKCILPAVLTLI